MSHEGCEEREEYASRHGIYRYFLHHLAYGDRHLRSCLRAQDPRPANRRLTQFQLVSWRPILFGQIVCRPRIGGGVFLRYASCGPNRQRKDTAGRSICTLSGPRAWSHLSRLPKCARSSMEDGSLLLYSILVLWPHRVSYPCW
eukprot:2060920-Amphidinium_carterae.1